MIIIILYFLLLFYVVFFEFFVPYEIYHNAVKYAIRIILPIPLIIYMATKGINVYSTMLIIAVSLCVVADILIINNFLAGMAGFVIAHIVIIAAYVTLNTGLSHNTLWILDIFLLIGAILILKIFKNQKFPINILLFGYMIILSLEIYSGASILQKTIFAVIGSILFWLCDFQVAYLNYVGKFSYYQQINHILYYGALFFITMTVR